MWHKLVWDIAQFDEIQRDMPDLKEPLGYAAINVCITASSLADWTIADFVPRRRAQGRPTTEAAVRAHIHRHVVQQPMCEAIANTAKHARLRAGAWPNGSVSIDWEDGDENSPPGYILRHIHEGESQSIAINAFSALQRNWWGELQNLGFSFPGDLSDAAWWQQKMNRIFGKRPAHDGTPS